MPSRHRTLRSNPAKWRIPHGGRKEGTVTGPKIAGFSTRWGLRASSVVILAMILGLAPVTSARAFGRASNQVLAQIQVHPTSGPAGTLVDVRGRGLGMGNPCPRLLEFKDSAGTTFDLQSLPHTDTFKT